MKRAFRAHSILPGFDLTMGFTVFYLSLIVLIPLGATFLKTFSAGWGHFWETVSGRARLASYRLSIGASLIAARSIACSACSPPGCWCAMTFPASVSSMRWWICPSLCRRRSPALR